MNIPTDPADPELPQDTPLRWTAEREQLLLRLEELLTDPTGQIHPNLVGLWLDLSSMPHPARGLVWIRNNPHVSHYLQGLAQGTIPLTHQGLHQLPSWRTAAHLRDLLMASGALPEIDRQILLFERWAHHRLLELDNPDHARRLRQFLTWRLLPKLHTNAARAPLSPGSRNTAADRFTAAIRFLTWLADRGHHLHQTSQADLDTWTVQQPGTATRVRTFLQWAMTNGHMPYLTIPAHQRTQRPPISQHHRLALLRRFVTDNTIPLRTRVAACLLLLYAQPVNRLVRLTIDDIEHHPDEIRLNLGTPASPVPPPIASLLLQLAANRTNMNTASNPHCRWLFPGGRAGQPLTPGTLTKQLQAHSIPVTQTRTAAFRQLVLQTPAPVTAHALGYSPHTATQHLINTGATWSRYPTTRSRIRHT